MKLSALFPLALASVTLALDIDFTSKTSINAGLALLAKGLMDYYNGNKTGETPGMFSNPYYWWEAGAAWGSMIDYWYYTNDTQYNDIIKSSLLFQIGTDWDYMPANQTTTEGNDDQGFWGITVMAAAEKNFDLPGNNMPSWTYLAQAVFNTMASRWDTDHCGGGLRWQIFTWNNGYNYKNAVANGCLFNLAARLARYTQNSTYVDWAEKVWNWVVEVKFIPTDGDAWPVYDGGSIEQSCSDTSPLEWTYNTGLYLAGTAFMYNYTGDTKWLTRAQNIWNRGKVFFEENSLIMFEAACQPSNQCNNDQRSFKGIFSRFLGLTSMMAPPLNDEIQRYLAATTPGILSSCTGGTDGHTCGLDWTQGKWDGKYGLGEQMSALEALQNRLVWTRPPPLTESTGGTSKSNGTAGAVTKKQTTHNQIDIQTKDKAGAGIITAILLLIMLVTAWWMIF
jgi:mannan endo-1,6-alpha-mannosidase